MKKLLTLLLLSPIAFSEPINIKCEYYSTLDMETFKVSATSGTEAFTIKTDTKEIINEHGAFPYTEKGNQIEWKSYSAIDVGDVYGMAWVYRLNRVSSELEHDFRDIKKPEGFEREDLYKLVDAENYPLRMTHSAKCKRVEALF